MQDRLRQVSWSTLEAHVGWVVEAIGRVLGGTPAERVLDRALRAHPQLDSSERRAVVEAVFGVGLWRRRLAFQVGKPAPSAEELLFALLSDLAGVDREQAAGWLGLQAKDYPARPAPAELKLRCSLPDWLATLLRDEWGHESDALADALNTPGPVFLRANLLRNERNGLAAMLREDGIETRSTAAARDGLRVVTDRPNLLGTAAHRQSCFEVQDEGSQLLGSLVGVSPGHRVLDLCAGAGGKTLQLASESRDQADIFAFDVDRERLERLRHRASRADARCIRISHSPPPEAARFDRVLIDAPCSELGALRRGPDRRWLIHPEQFASLPKLQLQLLERGFAQLAPAGLLVYATCTLRRAENEEVAFAFEAGHPAAVRVRPGEGWLPNEFVDHGFFRALPHRHGTDGFFAAVYRRAA